MNGTHSVFTFAPRAAPWWDLPAHVTAANLGWWLLALAAAAAVIYRISARAGGRAPEEPAGRMRSACPYENCHHNHPGPPGRGSRP